MRRKSLGNLGEKIAAKYLHDCGYKILVRNFRSKFGEIDIVALDGDFLVFIEVKTRWSRKFGPPEEAIIPSKVRRIIKAGQYYKLLHPELPESLRLDAVAIDLFFDGKVKRIKLIKNLTG
jgi:putative endonuclease